MTNKIESASTQKPAWRTILAAGLIAGILDGSAAAIMVYLSSGRGPEVVFRFVASGVFGTSAFSGGTFMFIAGVLFHMMIAMVWTVIFFFAFPFFREFGKHWFITGMMYGVVVWAGMNLVVVPLSATPAMPFSWTGAIKNMLILMVCIGLPVSWFVSRHYRNAD